MVNAESGIAKRIFFSIFILIICRLGSFIPVPGINPEVVSNLFSGSGSSFFGMFNLLSGGALGRLAIFSLSVVPYILSSIVMQLVFSPHGDSSARDPDWHRKMSLYSRALAVVLCFFQGFFVLSGLEKLVSPGVPVFVDNSYLLKFVGVCSIVGGTMILLWLGDRITSNGIGNGLSLIVFSGIVSELPSSISRFFVMFDSGSLSAFGLIFTFCLLCALMFLVLFVESSVKKISVQYPRRQSGNRVYAAGNSHIPLKVNMSGVVPPIFANAVMMFPVMLANLHSDSSALEIFLRYFSYGSIPYVVLHIVLIIFFSFFYSSFAFNVSETCSTLKRSGGFIPGRRPGGMTSEYLLSVMNRMTMIGSLYLAFVCAIPELFHYYYNVPFLLNGTSLLIMVSVVTDTVSQIHVHSFSDRYSSLMRKSKLWG